MLIRLTYWRWRIRAELAPKESYDKRGRYWQSGIALRFAYWYWWLPLARRVYK